jgi:hypothetical protein
VRTWQGVTCINNLRAQYPVPVDLADNLNIFKGRYMPTKPDSSRQIAYGILENIFNRFDKFMQFLT